MKHIENYKSFNEGIFSNKYDIIVKNIFEKIKAIFDIKDLSKTIDTPFVTFEYKLEETDSDLGYIDISIERFISNISIEFELKIDGSIIKCSYLLRYKIYRFFSIKFNEFYKNEKEKSDKIDFSNFENKYKSFDID